MVVEPAFSFNASALGLRIFQPAPEWESTEPFFGHKQNLFATHRRELPLVFPSLHDASLLECAHTYGTFTVDRRPRTAPRLLETG